MTDRLAEFVTRGQAAQQAVDALGAGRPSYWWHVRIRVIEREATHVECVSAADSRSDKWRGCTFCVLDLLQEGV